EVHAFMRRELVVPRDLAVLGMERDHRRGVEIVAGPVADIPGAGVADAPIDQVEFRIVAAGDPGGTATALARVAGAPGVATGLARAGRGERPPQTLAGLRIVAVDEVAGAVFRACDTHHQNAVRHG